MAPQPHIQGRTCAGESGARFFPKPRFALETGHLWGALVGGRHPTKPQIKGPDNPTWQLLPKDTKEKAKFNRKRRDGDQGGKCMCMCMCKCVCELCVSDLFVYVNVSCVQCVCMRVVCE